MPMTDPHAIAQLVAERLQGVKTAKVFGRLVTIDAQGTARDEDGTPIWEFEEKDHTSLTPEEIGSELESIFWYDQDIFESEQSHIND